MAHTSLVIDGGVNDDCCDDDDSRGRLGTMKTIRKRMLMGHMAAHIAGVEGQCIKHHGAHQFVGRWMG